MLFYDDIHIIICEYLENECKEYLHFVNRLEELDYMYITYTHFDNYVEYSKIRYLRSYNNITNLLKYRNLYLIHFVYIKNIKNDYKLPSSVKKILISRWFPNNNKKILEILCIKNNIELIFT